MPLVSTSSAGCFARHSSPAHGFTGVNHRVENRFQASDFWGSVSVPGGEASWARRRSRTRTSSSTSACRARFPSSDRHATGTV